MSGHLAILISPEGEEFYSAYGPMTKLRDRATRYAHGHVATTAIARCFGRHDDAFWNSERESRDLLRERYRGWTGRTEEISDDDLKREGHFVKDAPSDTGADPVLYATRDDTGAHGWTEDLGSCALWSTREDALAFLRSLPKREDRAYSIESY